MQQVISRLQQDFEVKPSCGLSARLCMLIIKLHLHLLLIAISTPRSTFNIVHVHIDAHPQLF